MQMRRPPSPQELSGLVDQYIREEIYYREARRMGLDANDTIVRRRMVQKLTFLTEDVATAAPLEETALKAYYDENIDEYRLPERISFKHRYFSSDRREDAEADARTALDDTEVTGDAFMLQLVGPPGFVAMAFLLAFGTGVHGNVLFGPPVELLRRFLVILMALNPAELDLNGEKTQKVAAFPASSCRV